MAASKPEIPRAVTIFVAALGTATIAAVSAEVALFGWRALPAWPVIAAFLGLLTAAGFLMVRFQHSRQVEALDLFEAVLAPAIFAFSGPVVVGLVVISKTVVEGIRRNRRVKAAFNIAQFALMAGVASLTFGALRAGDASTSHNLLALVAAMVTMFLVNKAALVTVIHLAEGAPLSRIVRGMMPVIAHGWLAGWVVNVAFGLLFVLAYARAPVALLLVAVPLATLHLAYRGYATALADRARLAGLHRASGALSGPINTREAIPRFLSEVRAAFDCEVAELVLAENDALVSHQARHGQPDRAVGSVAPAGRESVAAALIPRGRAERVRAGSHDEVGALLEREGHRDCMAAPLMDDGRAVGLLLTYDHRGPEGFEEGALAVLEALASEAGAALKKSQLLEAIFEERRKMADIVMQTSDGIFTVGRDGTVMTWNPAMTQISGFDAEAMVGSKALPLLRARGADGRELPLDGSLIGKIGSMPEEMQITARSDETRWLACSYSPVHEPDGRIGSVVVVARDVTKSHEIEQLKDDFIATVSHELRTPLTPIKGWASTLERMGDDLDPGARRQIAESISRQADRLERLIMNLLQVAQIERRTVDVGDAVLDAKAVAAKMVDEYRATRPGRAIRLEAPQGPCRARGDETSVEQIISNLLSNAVKYSPSDEPVDVMVRQHPGAIEIAVTDRGPGISAGDVDRIFQRFQRLGDHMTREQEGAGLGLYIARRLAEAMGASISVTTAPGAGATFTLILRSVPTLVAVG